MPRDNWCYLCDGMFSDEDMGDSGVCIYCETGGQDMGADDAAE